MTMSGLPGYGQRLGLLVVLALLPVAAFAQGQDDLDVTMRMVLDDDDLSERVVQELELPDVMQVAPAPGRPEFDGREQAAEARSQGRALGEQISEQARSNREELPVGRADGQLDLPPGLDDTRDQLPDLEPDLGQDPILDELPESDDLLDQDLLTEPELSN